MKQNEQINFLYLAETLQTKFPKFCSEFENLLNTHHISYDYLSPTKDIWARDYMPIQISKEKFIQFSYRPDYLKSKKWSSTISDVDSICKNLDLETIKSNIIIDGGNIIKYDDSIIMTEKVFKENPNYRRNELIKELEDLLEGEIIFIPQDPNDYTGHADGMIRFYNRNTVLINDYSREALSFQNSFFNSIDTAGLNIIQIPYNPYLNKTNNEANGTYINFLEMKDIIFLPIFNLPEDELVYQQFKNLYIEKNIVTINSNEIANDGGVLNCISWNILK